MADGNLISQLGTDAAKLAPPAVVSAYAMVSQGLPVIVGFLTLIYLAVQIGHLLWVWAGEMQAKRAARRAP